MEKPIKPADYGVYCEDGSFPATYGYFQLRYGVSKGEYCGFFHDMLGNELYTNVWRYGEQKWAGWRKINSDLNHKKFPSDSNYFNVNNNDTANFLFYKFSDENWCGMGIEPDGTLAIRVGTANIYRRIFRFKANADSIEISDH